MLNSDLLIPLKALGHETRLQIVEMLLSANLCVKALAQNLGISEGAVSQHLRILRKSGLIKGEKKGYWTHYQVQTEVLRQIGERLAGLPERVSNLRDLNQEISNTGVEPQNGGE